MVLANYCNLFSNPADGSFSVVKTDGTTYTSNSGTGANQSRITLTGAHIYGSRSRYANNLWVEIGHGDSAESPSDYELAAPDYTNAYLTPIGGGLNAHPASNGNRIFFDLYTIYANNTADDQIIKEVGVMAALETNAAFTAEDCVLLTRKVLNTPVVIAPGESYMFNYRLRIRDY